ncbi:MAG: DUF6428 family protein [Bacteroidota bacterium]
MEQKPMNWQDFKSRLHQNPDLTLQFQYAENEQVDAAYHITEVKQAPITSVDCGGVLNEWTEIVVQLWEPVGKEGGRAMQVNKALSIFNLVESKLSLNPDAVVKIEFGNSRFDTRQMYPAEFIIGGDNLVVSLSPDFTQCKAISRNGSCGTAASGDACCVLEPEKKAQKLELVAESSACCTPGGGCC